MSDRGPSSDHRHRIRPYLHDLSLRLRKKSPFPERLLWSRLRGGRFRGLKFRRQHCFGQYIVDFYCPVRSLVIEVDGMTHCGRGERDGQRTRYLEDRYGVRVIRVTDDDVVRDIDAVIAYIDRECRKREEGKRPDPPPAPA